ncbi:very short patch repair endonuclease [Sphingopyxis solisilvae]|uniref:very short patch repair endonuclease n=1 Tax=Sphingopyxis solisilvae TaxID=1886788 RepID=UPI002B4AADC2|nr:very short patch repair endonuclease [Sphingopyxis solisilvae]
MLVDRLTPERRSWLMSRVGSKNTSPEMRVRRLAHSMGLRFRLHRKDLPGNPDLAFPKYGAVLFVHGCFWHRHPGCRKASTPKSRTEFWDAKFVSNVKRDRRNEDALRAQGWRVFTIWECEAKSDEEIHAVLSQIPLSDRKEVAKREARIKKRRST